MAEPTAVVWFCLSTVRLVAVPFSVSAVKLPSVSVVQLSVLVGQETVT